MITVGRKIKENTLIIFQFYRPISNTEDKFIYESIISEQLNFFDCSQSQSRKTYDYVLFNRNAASFTFWLECSLVVIFYFSVEV